MASDIEILTRALNFEAKRAPQCWDATAVGAGRADINRLSEAGYISPRVRSSRIGFGQYGPTLYSLTSKGRGLAANPEQPVQVASATEILAAMDLIVGFDDIKKRIAFAIASGKRIHFLLEGPPASSKSVLMEAVRVTVPNAQMVFGSRTSAAGLSDLLFEKKPTVLLADECDKMRMDTVAVMLGLMEHGEIIETKHKGTRGLKLSCMVIAACNSSAKMPKEFLSRFAFHPLFQPYTRDEFIEICRVILSRTKNCPEYLAQLIGEEVFDCRLGDIRKARSVWDMATAKPDGLEVTKDDVLEVLQTMEKYSPGAGHSARRGEARLI